MLFLGCLPCGGEKGSKSNSDPPVNDDHATPNRRAAVAQSDNTLAKIDSNIGMVEKECESSSKDIWQIAFDELRKDNSTQALVVEYEDYLQPYLAGLASSTDSTYSQYPETNDPLRSAIGATNSLAIALGDLDERDRQAIMERLAERRLEEIQKSGTQRSVFLTVTKIMGKVKETVGDALSTCPPAAAGWALACLGIMPVIEKIKQINANQEGLGYIISKLPWYTNLVELVNADTWSTASSTQETKILIRDTIIRLYKLLITYQLWSFHVRQHQWETIASNIVQWNDWNGKLEEIKFTENELMRYIESNKSLRKELLALQVEQVTILRDLTENMHDIRNDTRNNTMHKLWERFKLDLAELDQRRYQEYVDGLEKLEPGTGYGVLKHQQYMDWENNDRAIGLLEERDKIVCSFFFKDKPLGQADPNKALCRIFYDILKALPKLPEIKSLNEKIDKLEKEEISAECKVLWEVIDTISQQRAMVIVLDALDESVEEKRNGLLDRLGSYQSDFPDARIKFLITTRPLGFISREYERCLLRMDDDPNCREAIQKDILQVAGQKLDKFAKDNEISSPKKEELFGILAGYRDSTYLFIKLLFVYVDKSPGFNQNWVRVFKALPTTVSQAYSAFLNGVKEGFRQLVIAMIKILLAGTRLLTVTEMKIAVLVQIGDHTEIQTKEDLFRFSDEYMENIIRENCGFIFDIVAGRINFIHQTVKDYFISPTTAKEMPDWIPKIDLADCHRTLARICMNYIPLPFIVSDANIKTIDDYLRLETISQSQYHKWCKDSFEFGEYGFSNWVVHFKRGHEEVQDKEILLGMMASEYSQSVFDLAVDIFCCSAVPSHVEVNEFQEVVPQSHPRRLTIFTALSHSFVENYYSHGGFLDLLCGIELARMTVLHTDHNDPKLVKRLGILAEGLLRRFDRDQDYSTVKEAEHLLNQAVLKAGAGHSDRAYVLYQRANCLWPLFNITGDIEYIDRAILDAKEAMRLSNQQFDHAMGLASLLCQRGMYHKSRENLDEAIRIMEDRLTAAPEGVYASSGFHELGFFLLERYKLQNNIEDLFTATKMFREAVRLFPPDSLSIPYTLWSLADSLERLFDRNHEEPVLLEALEAMTQAVSLSDEDHPARRDFLSTFLHLRKKQNELGVSE